MHFLIPCFSWVPTAGLLGGRPTSHKMGLRPDHAGRRICASLRIESRPVGSPPPSGRPRAGTGTTKLNLKQKKLNADCF